jgi:hypothetical protein
MSLEVANPPLYFSQNFAQVTDLLCGALHPFTLLWVNHSTIWQFLVPHSYHMSQQLDPRGYMQKK